MWSRLWLCSEMLKCWCGQSFCQKFWALFPFLYVWALFPFPYASSCLQFHLLRSFSGSFYISSSFETCAQCASAKTVCILCVGKKSFAHWCATLACKVDAGWIWNVKRRGKWLWHTLFVQPASSFFPHQQVFAPVEQPKGQLDIHRFFVFGVARMEQWAENRLRQIWSKINFFCVVLAKNCASVCILNSQ